MLSFLCNSTHKWHFWGKKKLTAFDIRSFFQWWMMCLVAMCEYQCDGVEMYFWGCSAQGPPACQHTSKAPWLVMQKEKAFSDLLFILPPSLGRHHTPLFFFFFPSSVCPPVFSHFEHSKAALGGSDAVHLGWSLTCSAERKHLARDTWKHLTHWIIKTQHSPGVLYNGGNYFEGKYMEREQSCSNCYQDSHRTTLFSFGLFYQAGLDLFRGKIK